MDWQSTPFFPPSGPARRLAQGPQARSKFLQSGITRNAMASSIPEMWVSNQPPSTRPSFPLTPIRLILSSSLLASERLPISLR
jgi:hypothetical protein